MKRTRVSIEVEFAFERPDRAGEAAEILRRALRFLPLSVDERNDVRDLAQFVSDAIYVAPVTGEPGNGNGGGS